MKEKVDTRHKWTKDDHLITIYYVLYGLDKLSVNNEIELAEWIIGASFSSLLNNQQIFVTIILKKDMH